MDRIRGLSILLLMALSFPLAANSFSDLYVIPAAGHVSGMSGTTWQSDVVIHNFQNTPIAVELAAVDTGVSVVDNVAPIEVDGSAAVTVAPGATLRLEDVLAGHRGRSENLGAILIGADQPFAVVSRTFAVTPSGSTVGQTVGAVSDFLDNVRTAGSGVAFVPALTSNGRHRTNLGFLAAASPDAQFVIEVSLVNAQGVAIGTTRTFAIPSGATAHLMFPSTLLASGFEDAVARFRIVSGSGAVAPFASVVESASNNALFLNGGFPPGASVTSGSASFFHDVLRSAR